MGNIEESIMQDLRSRAACLICDCGHTGVKDLDGAIIIAGTMDFAFSPVSKLDFLKRQIADRFREHKRTCGTWLAQQKWTTTRFPEGAEL